MPLGLAEVARIVIEALAARLGCCLCLVLGSLVFVGVKVAVELVLRVLVIRVVFGVRLGWVCVGNGLWLRSPKAININLHP